MVEVDFLEFVKTLESRILLQVSNLFADDSKKVKELSSDMEDFCKSNGDFFSKIYDAAINYDNLLGQLNIVESFDDSKKTDKSAGIIALNGTSGVGQSYVMKFITKELEGRGVPFERACLLGMRPPRDTEGHKDPYIFVNKSDKGYECIHTGDKFSFDDVYFEYESRPGAANAILQEDLLKSNDKLLYLETVIPTLHKMQTESIKGVPALGDKVKVAYLAADSGVEWVYRLVAREPHKLHDAQFRNKLLGRIESSLDDMYVAANHNIPTAVHVLDQGPVTAKKVLAAWGIL